MLISTTNLNYYYHTIRKTPVKLQNTLRYTPGNTTRAQHPALSLELQAEISVYVTGWLNKPCTPVLVFPACLSAYTKLMATQIRSLVDIKHAL